MNIMLSQKISGGHSGILSLHVLGKNRTKISEIVLEHLQLGYLIHVKHPSRTLHKHNLRLRELIQGRLLHELRHAPVEHPPINLKHYPYLSGYQKLDTGNGNKITLSRTTTRTHFIIFDKMNIINTFDKPILQFTNSVTLGVITQSPHIIQINRKSLPRIREPKDSKKILSNSFFARFRRQKSATILCAVPKSY